jgi:ribosome-binding protein aMBF1 (putative translation factor)
MNNTGHLIKLAREKRELSQTMVSTYMGFTNVFLGRIEAGHCLLPARHVEKLSRILNVDKEDILKAMKKDMSERLDKKAR